MAPPSLKPNFVYAGLTVLVTSIFPAWLLLAYLNESPDYNIDLPWLMRKATVFTVYGTYFATPILSLFGIVLAFKPRSSERFRALLLVIYAICGVTWVTLLVLMVFFLH